jgi:glycosyltransferase involved in cell wall biosynthesis
MRLAVVDHIANIGGGRRFTSSLVAALARSSPDCQIRLITSREALVSGWLGDLSGLPVETVGLVTESTLDHWLPAGRIRDLPGTWRLKSTFRRALQNTLFKVERQLNRHLTGMNAVYWPWPSFALDCNWNIPTVMTIHDLLWHHFSLRQESDQRALDRQVAQWLTQSVATVAITDVLRQEIEQFYPGSARRIEVIRQPAPILPAPLQGIERERLLARWNIQGGFGLCPAGLWPHKNHKNLILALAELKRRGQRVALVCSGEFTDEAFGSLPPARTRVHAQDYRELALQAGLILGQDIIGVGYVGDVELATLYASAGFVVMASLTEGGSFPILEGAAQGVPLVCSDIEVYREQIEFYGLKPIYFDPTDPSSIAGSIARRIGTPPSNEELAAAAQRVRSRSWANVAQEYLRVFESVV